MIEVQLTPECAAKLLRELRRAGADEIGGVLATERVADRVFRIVDLSVQRKGAPSRHSCEMPASISASCVDSTT